MLTLQEGQQLRPTEKVNASHRMLTLEQMLRVELRVVTFALF